MSIDRPTLAEARELFRLGMEPLTEDDLALETPEAVDAASAIPLYPAEVPVDAWPDLDTPEGREAYMSELLEWPPQPVTEAKP